MKRKLIPATYILIVALVAGLIAASLAPRSSKLLAPDYALASGSNPVSPAGGPTGIATTFTYQGRLTNSGVPVNGNHDFTFKLFDASSGGNQIDSTITLNSQPVTNGVFTVVLDFGPTAFYGDARFLEIAVRASGVGSLITLSPRQRTTVAPFARSAPWFNTSGKPFGYNPLRQVGRINVLDSTNNTGLYTSVAIGIDGLPIISYHDYGGPNGNELKGIHCEDRDCTGRTISTLATFSTPGTSFGVYTSITVGSDGLAIISYHDIGDGTLNVAHCNNVTCTSATISTLDSAGDVGRFTSITINKIGVALISYYDVTNGNLKVARCNNVACTAATISTLDSTGDVGERSSITITSDGLGRISYYDVTNGNLKLAFCGDDQCSSASVGLLTVDSTGDVGDFSSIATGRDGFPIISYYDATNGDLKVAHCNNDICSSRTISTLDSTGTVGEFTSMAIGVDGLAYIVYQGYPSGSNGDLKGAHCIDTACTSASILTIDPNVASTAFYTSLTIGVDGMPFATQYDFTNGTLRSIHCGSPFCISSFRRR